MLSPEERRHRRILAVRRWEQKNPHKKREYKRREYQRHAVAYKARSLQQTRQQRQRVIQLFGGRCETCGFSDWRALQIDHKNGQGGKDRARFKNKYSYLRAVMAERDRYQLLCANCNWIKRYECGEHRWKVG